MKKLPFDHRWFALGSLFSLFSLFYFVNGDWRNLMFLMFLPNLIFLAPVQGRYPSTLSASEPMTRNPQPSRILRRP
jgi:hypothetical protein